MASFLYSMCDAALELACIRAVEKHSGKWYDNDKQEFVLY